MGAITQTSAPLRWAAVASASNWPRRTSGRCHPAGFPDAQRRIRLGLLRDVRHRLVGAGVERTDDRTPAGRRLEHAV
jgi:hypothetical protein